MKFRCVEIEENYYRKEKGKFKGRIGFATETDDWITLNLDDEFARKILSDCLPLFERALSERVEIIKKELFNDTKRE